MKEDVTKKRKDKGVRRRRVDAIKVKGKLEEDKEECVVRLFAFNCNVLGP